VWLCVTRALMPALLAVGDESAINFWRNFLEIHTHELRRIHRPRTRVNKLPYHYADPFIDASSLRINMRV
jgi:hypothetical protein